MSPYAPIAIKRATTGTGFLFLWWQNVNSYPNPMFSPLDCFPQSVLFKCSVNININIPIVYTLLFLTKPKTCKID